MTATLRFRSGATERIRVATVAKALDYALIHGAISATVGCVTYVRDGLVWTYHEAVRVTPEERRVAA